MQRFAIVTFVLAGVGWLTAAQVEARLPGTLNFQNITATNIDQNVAETANNEKEVEYGDFDNDGDLDVVVAVAYSDFGTRKNKLYRNDAGVFNEISGAPAIPGFAGSDVSRNAFFRDYNADGWLDIIIVNDANTAGEGGRTKIYMNQHPGDVFSHYTEEGMARLGPNTGGAACGGISIDVDNDDDADLYVGNYPGPSQDTMYLNDGNGFFASVTASQVPVESAYAVDVSSADLNGDGKLDILVSNHTGNQLYYNDNNDAGSVVGDYSYTGSAVNLGNATPENAMEPGDFNHDGLVDFYWSNNVGSGDRIKLNTGNNASGQAIFSTISTLPASVTARVSRKATVADLNQDGRVDILVMKEDGTNSRPTVLRNTTVAGMLSFVDWSPATIWPNSATLHKGWHAAAFDADGDGYKDVFLGGFTNDHLFKNVESNEMLEGGLSGDPKLLPAVFNAAPIAVDGASSAGTPDVYEMPSIGAGGYVAVVLNGPSDHRLELLDTNDAVLVNSNRGGLGIEEAFQLDTTGIRRIRVTQLQAFADGDLDADIDLIDAGLAQNCYLGEDTPSSEPGCARFDADGDGDVDLADYNHVPTVLLGPGVPAAGEYILEALSRS